MKSQSNSQNKNPTISSRAGTSIVADSQSAKKIYDKYAANNNDTFEYEAEFYAALLQLALSCLPEKLDHTIPTNHEAECETQFIEDDEGRPCTCRLGGHNAAIDTIEQNIKLRFGG